MKINRNEPCPCGSGKKYKKCCFLKIESPSDKKCRLLVVGAGATLEECTKSGTNPQDQFPTVSDFVNKLSHVTHSLHLAAAAYLETNKIPFNPGIFTLKEGVIPPEVWNNNPIEIFKRLEASDPINHNIERLLEHTWNTFGGAQDSFWDELQQAIYLSLFLKFVPQFGINGSPEPYKKLEAGAIICQYLLPGDKVLNLNYDIGFDVALKQSGKAFCYSPDDSANEIVLYKPHGSFNLYANRHKKAFRFVDVYQIPGTLTHPDAEGGEWNAHLAILPPRLNKKYEQHPIAQTILRSFQDFRPGVVTFWGVGLASSDADLIEIYKNTCDFAEEVQFINPSDEAYHRASQLIKRPIQQFRSLDEWAREENKKLNRFKSTLQ